MFRNVFEMHLTATCNKFHLESRLPPGAGGAELPSGASFCAPKGPNELKPALELVNASRSRSRSGAGDANMVKSRTVVYSVHMKR